MKVVVVTGAAGFVGHAVCERLAGLGHSVIGLSRRAVAGLPWLRTVRNYSEFSPPPGAVLVHLAEPSRMSAVAQDADLAAALQATMRSLAHDNWDGLVYASSAVVYGDATARAHTVLDTPNNSSVYATVKLANEETCLAAGGAVVRLANAYGRGMSDQNVIADIVRQLDGPGPIRVGDTGPTRDFIAIPDVASAFAALAVSGEHGVFNVGTGIGTSVGSLARLLAELAGNAERQVVSSANPPNERSCLVVDPEDTIRRLAWRPEVTLREGLSQLLSVH
jgi:UDP-glucose 4-epimerase